MATGVLRRRSLVVQQHRMGSPRPCMATLDAPDRFRGAHRRSRRLDDRVRQRGGRPRSRSPAEARPGLGKSPRLHGVGAMAGRHRSPPSRTNPTGAGSAGTETITCSGLRSIALISRNDARSLMPTSARVRDIIGAVARRGVVAVAFSFARRSPGQVQGGDLAGVALDRAGATGWLLLPGGRDVDELVGDAAVAEGVDVAGGHGHELQPVASGV